MTGPEADRALTLDDVEAGLALSREAGWNQAAGDWRLILTTGSGRGVVAGGQLVATAAVLPYGARLGWICMVLVTRSARRRGIATRLMRWAIDSLAADGRVAGLDATEAGREVYARMGFHETLSLTRFHAAAPHGGPVAPAVRRMTGEDRAAVAEFDARVFGADRGRLIGALADRVPDLALVAEDCGRICGLSLARDGDRCMQIGPLLADDAATAEALVSQACARAQGAVLVDVPDRHAGLARWLAAHGFAAQRGFTRMLNGAAAAPADPARTFAIAGPELA